MKNKTFLKGNKKLRYLLCLLPAALFIWITCLLRSSPLEADPEDTWSDAGFLDIGHDLTIRNTDNRFSLIDIKDTLSATGLYYAAWAAGSPEPYQNGNGETSDLYDAQLYFLLAERESAAQAETDMADWMETGRNNYQILAEEEIVCNGQSYRLLTYNCISEDNPHDRGVSAFGVYKNDAMCIELTCREAYEEDLKSLLLHFLDNCTYTDR